MKVRNTGRINLFMHLYCMFYYLNCFTTSRYRYAKLNEIEVFTQELRLLNYAFSVICIQESWLTEQDDLCNIHLEDYTCISLGKTSSTKGGLIMYIQSQYKYKVLQVITNENWEGQFIEVTGGGLIKPVIFCNIYRPHES